MSCSILTCLTKKQLPKGSRICAKPSLNVTYMSYLGIAILQFLFLDIGHFFWTPYSILIALKALEYFSSILRSIALNVR